MLSYLRFAAGMSAGAEEPVRSAPPSGEHFTRLAANHMQSCTELVSYLAMHIPRYELQPLICIHGFLYKVAGRVLSCAAPFSATPNLLQA